MAPVLEFRQITYYYQSGDKRIDILDNVDCAFEPGLLYTIVGPSGSGKTTTLTLAGALETPRSGSICYKGQDIKEIGYTNYRSKHVAIVFQAYNLLPYLSPLQNVIAAMEITKNPVQNKKRRAQELLSRICLTDDQMGRIVQKLSGGEQQRVAIARALAADADILLADEPTGNLDADTAKSIVEIFRELAHKDNKCVIAVTHAQAFAEQADVVFSLKNRLLEYIR